MMSTTAWWRLVAVGMGAALFRSCLIAADDTSEPAISSGDFEFAHTGPCATSSFKTTLEIPSESELRSLGLKVTVPVCTANATSDWPLPAPPYPVAFFFSGFQSRASWYKPIVDRLASWGYIVVQYDLPFFSLPPVAAELKAFPSLCRWLKEQSTTPTSPLYHIITPNDVVVAGHSRGGKVAALLFADAANDIRAAWLIDPIDTSSFAPVSPQNPSATKALQASGREIGVTGAGVLGSCNPTEGGVAQYQMMFTVAGPNSWEVVIPGASHSSFSDAGPIVNVAQDALCGKGRLSRSEVAVLATAPMLTWFYKQRNLTTQRQQQVFGDNGVMPVSLSSASRNEALVVDDEVLATFHRWIEHERAAGVLAFKEKKPATENIEGALRPAGLRLLSSDAH